MIGKIEAYFGIRDKFSNIKFLNENTLVFSIASNLVVWNLKADTFKPACYDKENDLLIESFYLFDRMLVLIKRKSESLLNLVLLEDNSVQTNRQNLRIIQSIELECHDIIDVCLKENCCILLTSEFELKCLNWQSSIQNSSFKIDDDILLEKSLIRFYFNDLNRFLLLDSFSIRTFRILDSNQIQFDQKHDLNENYLNDLKQIHWSNRKANEFYFFNNRCELVLFDLDNFEIRMKVEILSQIKRSFSVKHESFLSYNQIEINDAKVLSENENERVEEKINERKEDGASSSSKNEMIINDFLLLSFNSFICLLNFSYILIFTLVDSSLVIKHWSKLEANSLNDLDSNEKIVQIILNSEKTCLICLTDSNKLLRLNLNNQIYSSFDKKFLSMKQLKQFNSAKMMLGLDLTFSNTSTILCTFDESSVSIWNYATRSIELSKKFDETIHWASLHSSGLHLAIKFFNRLNIYSVFYNYLKLEHSIKQTITQFGLCKYSPNGNRLALSHSGTIKIYDSWTFALILELSIKIGKIQHFIWINDDDYYLAGCTNSGHLCIWNTYTGQRVAEYVEKTLNLKRISSTFCCQKHKIYALDHLNSRLRIFSFDQKQQIDKNGILVGQNKYSSYLDLNQVDDLVVEHNSIDLSMILMDRMNNECVIDIFQHYLIVANCETSGRAFILNLDSNQIEFDRRVFASSISFVHMTSLAKWNQEESSENNDLVLIVANYNCHLISLIHLTSSNSESSVSLDSLFRQIEILSDRNDLRKNQIDYGQWLKQNLIDLNDEQNYQLTLKEMFYEEQLKQINYESKLNIGYLRTALKDLQELNEHRKNQLQTKLEQMNRSFQNDDLKILNEKFETKLCKFYAQNHDLKLEYQILNEKNVNLIEKIHQIEEKEQRAKISNESSNCENVKHENSKITRFMRRIATHLDNENEKLESKSDHLFSLYKQNLNHLKSLFQNKITSIDEAIFYVKTRLSNLASLPDQTEPSQIRRRSISIDYSAKKRSCLDMNKIPLIKLNKLDNEKNENNSNLKSTKCINLREKIDKYRKIIHLICVELKNSEKHLFRLREEQLDLSRRIRENENVLLDILAKKKQIKKCPGKKNLMLIIIRIK